MSKTSANPSGDELRLNNSTSTSGGAIIETVLRRAVIALATFRRKIDVFGSTVNGLRPSKDRRAAGGLF
jgi:hypothetical protein